MAWWAKASTAPDPDHLMAGGGDKAPHKSGHTVKFEELVGPKLLNQDGNEISTSAALKGKKFVMLYFSAHWCPPCRRFTPLLASAYKAHTECIAAENKNKGEDEGDTDDAIEADEIEVIFISSDSVWTQYNQYRSSMPWLSVPFSNLHSLKIKDELSSKYGVRGIPTLIVLDGCTGEVVTKNGRGEYANYFRGEYSSGPLSGCVVS